MLNKIKAIFVIFIISINYSMFAFAESSSEKCMKRWVSKSDKVFAKDCVDMAFSNNLKDRQTLAWMFFTRVNQLIPDSHEVSESGRVPQWMAWATDKDTFQVEPTFKYTKKNRDDLVPVTKKRLLTGDISNERPDGANEEVTRNAISYDYLTNTAKLNTKTGVFDYIKAGNRVDMPVGSVEIKASWLKVPPGGAPKGALIYKFKSDTYWWRGIHIMVKMKSLPKDENLFYTEEPSWFWTTFEFNNNPGVAHVRQNLITQRASLSLEEINSILMEGGISKFGFEAYAPNGTQIRYTDGGAGETPVILGHTDMEDFAGLPNNAQPNNWSSFNASCHTCHATAAIKLNDEPTLSVYFPFTVPVGALSEQYYGPNNSASGVAGPTYYLGDGFVPLDFMWPIAFNAK